MAAIGAADVPTAGSASVSVVTPAPGGGTSSALSVTITGGATLTVSATTIASTGSVTVTLMNGPGGSTDWLGLAAVGAPNTSFVSWTYVGAGVTTRSWTPPTPAPGTYEFRLFLNDGYTRAATSPSVTVSP
jgi:hypothetical protein